MTAPAFAIPLKDIDACFDGAIPCTICSVAADGVPNVTYLSIVHLLDDEHVGLSRQFFNKTIANMLVNPRVEILLIEPGTARQFRIHATYERTEQEGELFDKMRIRLDAVASQVGMSKVFKLAAVDVCRVLQCEPVPGDFDLEPPPSEQLDLGALDQISRRINAAADMDQLINVTLDSLDELLGFQHSLLLLVDERGDRLYTVASRGYPESGAGSEVCFGDGIIGVAAQRRQTINLSNLPGDLTYSQAVRYSVQRAGGAGDLESEIDLPGLPDAYSQLAVPVIARDRLLGLLLLQSQVQSRFRVGDETLLNLVARELGLAMALLRADQPSQTFVAEVGNEAGALAASQVKHYAADDSIFVDNDYVIKGVAGRILWRLLQSYAEERRVDFTNKEIRLDPSLDLPDIKDNLESRLILLRRRLEDRCELVRIASAGRGRIRLNVQRDFVLREISE